MKRFWMRWRHECPVRAAGHGCCETCARDAPFLVWLSGQDLYDGFIFVGLVDAESELMAWKKVWFVYPDANRHHFDSFCDEKPIDWTPGGRFEMPKETET